MVKSNLIKRLVMLALGACMTLGASQSAWAQIVGDDSSTGSTFSSTSTSTTTSAVTLGGIILTVYALTPKGRAAFLQDYLEQHRAQVNEGLALGAGDAVEDLAQLFGVPKTHLAPFGQLLRARRARLSMLMGHHAPISAQAALDFAQLIDQGLRSDPRLTAIAPNAPL